MFLFRLKRILHGFCLTAAATATAVVQTQTICDAIRPLTLADCVEAAVRHNFDVQIEAKGVEVARHRLSGSYGYYDPELRARGFRGHSLSPGGIDEQNRPFAGTLTDRDSFEASLGGFVPTGL